MCELLLVPGQESEPPAGIEPASLAERCTSGGIKRRRPPYGDRCLEEIDRLLGPPSARAAERNVVDRFPFRYIHYTHFTS